MLIMHQSIFNVYTLINPHMGSILSVTKMKGWEIKHLLYQGAVTALPPWVALIGAVIDHLEPRQPPVTFGYEANVGEGSRGVRVWLGRLWLPQNCGGVWIPGKAEQSQGRYWIVNGDIFSQEKISVCRQWSIAQGEAGWAGRMCLPLFWRVPVSSWTQTPVSAPRTVL